MWTLAFLIVAAICGFGWFMMYVVALALLYYMKEKGYIAPNEADMRRCSTYIMGKIFKKKRS